MDSAREMKPRTTAATMEPSSSESNSNVFIPPSEEEQQRAQQLRDAAAAAASKQNQQLMQQQHQQRKLKTGTYKAKALISLSGVIFALCGACLICAQNAGLADFYFYAGEADNQHQNDNTYTFFMDGLVCKNGECQSVFASNCTYCCADLHDRLINYRSIDIAAGSVQLLFSFLMFATLFIRFLMQLGKELVGAQAAKTSIFAKVEFYVAGMSRSYATQCVLFSVTAILMCGLLISSVFLAIESQAVLNEPLCVGVSTSFPFNESLSSVDPEHFSQGRATHLVLIGSSGALLVGLMYLVWLCTFVCCALRNTKFDDDESQQQQQQSQQQQQVDIDEILNSKEYENNPEYKEYIEQYKRGLKAAEAVNQYRAQQNHQPQQHHEQKQRLQQQPHKEIGASRGLSLLDDDFVGAHHRAAAGAAGDHRFSTRNTNHRNIQQNQQQQQSQQQQHYSPRDNESFGGGLPSTAPSSAAATTAVDSDNVSTTKKKRKVITVRRPIVKKQKNTDGQHDDRDRQEGDDDDDDNGGDGLSADPPRNLRATMEPPK